MATIFATDERVRQAKELWGQTAAYREFEQKSANRSDKEEKSLGMELMDIFVEFGKHKDGNPDSDEAQQLVAQLQDFITAHYYTCTDEILESLGQMYIAGTEMTDNIDKHGGEGTAAFVNKAIEAYLYN